MRNVIIINLLNNKYTWITVVSLFDVLGGLIDEMKNVLKLSQNIILRVENFNSTD